ncbi:MAG: hypothetical protein V3R94_10315 [Acidobacteriota bacterium]
MELQRLGVKIFLQDSSQIDLRNMVPVFHSWIQNKVVEDHLLVDVHNYSHVHRGPGILLVAHEGNFSIDLGDDRMGFLYCRKQPLEGPLRNRLKTIIGTTLKGVRLLESESRLKGIKFKTDELLLVANDRLKAPNIEATFLQLEPELTGFFSQLLDDEDVTLARQEDSRERFAVRVSAGHAQDTQALLDRLG